MFGKGWFSYFQSQQPPPTQQRQPPYATSLSSVSPFQLNSSDSTWYHNNNGHTLVDDDAVGGGDHSLGGMTVRLSSFVDETEDRLRTTVKTEDELVERLLTQFPVYGSHYQHAQQQQQQQGAGALGNTGSANGGATGQASKGLNSSEWFLSHVYGGSSSKSNTNTSLAASSSSVNKESKTDDSDTPVTQVEKSNEKKIISCEHWDLDEQNLWKTTRTATAAEDDPDRKSLVASKKGQYNKSIPNPHARNTSCLNGSKGINNGSITNITNGSVLLEDERRQQWVNGGINVDEISQSQHQIQQRRLYFRRPVHAAGTRTDAVTITPDIRSDRQHWMPDQLCKQCYSCETPFTVFRRRHHCRLCGQVFCNACSAFFVNWGNSSTIRVCQLCYDQVAQNGGMLAKLAQPDVTALGLTSIPDTVVTSQSAGQQQIHASTTALVNVLDSPEHDSKRRTQLLSEQTRLSLHGALDAHENGAAAGAQSSNSVLAALGKNALSAEESTGISSNRSATNVADNQDFLAATELLKIKKRSTGNKSSTSAVLALPAKIERAISGGSANTSTTITTAMSKNNADRMTAASDQLSAAELARQGNRHLGLMAANHLELLMEELLRIHAPLLWDKFSKNINDKSAEPVPTDTDVAVENDVNATSENLNSETCFDEKMKSHWLNKLLSLATRACATVDPIVKKGDLLDIRPYCKIKVIPGGSPSDCAYISGVVFRKTVSHKKMAKEIENPRLMLLSGGIEFTRKENRIASLETLFEQEEKYMEILVGKILKLKPDVLLVGRSVSRIAQELLLKAGVVLIQHVKATLLSRISRQTGATIISSTDHVMNQFGENVLGKCFRFRLATFRDNETWHDGGAVTEAAQTQSSTIVKQHFIKTLLSDPELSNHERQAALAANKLGEGVLDGSEAIKTGLAKRGVAQNYVMIEGCPKNLGCTVVLRGAERAALKQIKVVFKFMINMAYNLRLETSYLRERGARIRPDLKIEKRFAQSTSLCVDYGPSPTGKKVRPWNGSNNETVNRLPSSEITAFDHQAILITSVWMTEKAQCCPAEVKGICYYSMQDVALGQFLRDSCFNLSLKCQNSNCKKSVLDHSLSFVHNDGLINITVEELDEDLPPSPLEESKECEEDVDESAEDSDADLDRPIATWTYCVKCRKVVTPLVYISESTWKLSFGKFLEIFFYNRDAIMNAPEHGCYCNVQSETRLYFGCGRLAASFNYERVRPFGVFVRRTLPMEAKFYKDEALRRLDLISSASSKLFIKFDKHITKVSREARSLFNSPVNRPEHLQTVLSELNSIGSEVDHAAKALQAKIASVSDNFQTHHTDISVAEALFRFPWFARRYLFTLTSAWNEKLSVTGQAITVMKKLAASSSSRHDGVIGPNVAIVGGDSLSDELMESLRRLVKLKGTSQAQFNITDITQVLPSLPGNDDLEQDGDYDDEFDDPDHSIDFVDGVDADVVASRRRLLSKSSMDTSTSSRSRPRKSLGTRRTDASSSSTSRSNAETVTVPPRPTPGGAVKSAITRFFNRGGRDSDQYTVDLGIFSEGRPRLAVGANNLIVPVYDEQLSSIIAYSLSSFEYAKQFKHFSKVEVPQSDADASGSKERSRASSTGQSVPDKTANEVKRRSESQDVSASQLPVTPTNSSRASELSEVKEIERRMLVRSKSHIKHTFRDFDEKVNVTCKFVCTTYWATQFHAVRQIFLANTSPKLEVSDGDSQFASEIEQCYVESLSCAYLWAASGGKSGASFARTSDDRFVIKCISRTELQMFLDCAPAYFEYLSKAFFHGLPTVLCKIVGVYQIGVHNRVTGKRSMEQVAVMQNIFYNKKITRVFDLKGSLRGRFAAHIRSAKDDHPDTPISEASVQKRSKTDGVTDDERSREMEPTSKKSADNTLDEDVVETDHGPGTLLDGDFLEFTQGRPMPMTDRAKAVFQMSILNDTLFLSIINVLDYSILVGIDEEKMELVVGIIDFMRQYDILKQMERVGKSLPMVVGSEAPTIIQPPLYKARFTHAMERYFMTVPSKWTAI